MKKLLKILLLLSLSLAQALTLAMEKEEIQQQQPFPFFDLPEELNIEIFKSFIWDLFKIPRDFYNLKEKLLNIRLSSKRINILLDELFTEPFIEELAQKINEYSNYPISSYQLAKILLNKNQFAQYKQKHLAEANGLSQNMLSALVRYRNLTIPGLVPGPGFISTRMYYSFLRDYGITENIEDEIKKYIKAGANMDFVNEEGLSIPLHRSTRRYQSFASAHPELLKILCNSGTSLKFEKGLCEELAEYEYEF